MRISDWSSDVCSSDLGDTGSIEATADQRAFGAILHQIEAEIGPAPPPAPRNDPFARAGGVVQQDQSAHDDLDRKSVEEGKSVTVSVDLGGRRIIKKTKTHQRQRT